MALTILNQRLCRSFNPGPSWQIKGTGDFNNDGRSYILWQNTDGTPAHLADERLQRHSPSVPVGPFNPGSSWHIVGSGDYNIDQRSDILWQARQWHAGNLVR